VRWIPLAAAVAAAVLVIAPQPARPQGAVPTTAPMQPPTLEEALTRALAAAPEREVAAARVRAAGHAVRQAGRRPNPSLEAEWENLAGTGELAGLESSEARIGLGWTLELGGQRPARVGAARAEQDLAAADSLVTDARLAAAVREAYLAVQVVQARHQLQERLLRRDDAALRELRRQVAAGAISTLDTLRARLAREATVAELARTERELAAACRDLARLWGEQEAAFTTVADTLASGPPPRSRADLLADLAAAPALAATERTIAARRAAVAVAERAQALTLDVGVGVRLENATGDRGLVLGLAAPLPLLDDGSDGAAAARAEVAAAEARQRQASRDLARAVDVAAARLQALHAEATTLERELLPLARAAYAEARDHLARGRLALTDVLAVRADLLALLERRLEVLSRYHATAAAVTAITGRPALEDQR
jgi:cobalt-zinc-cadmium efflux system outer membrane protein